MANIEKGIKLRSGKILLPRRSYYDYSDSDSDDVYLCDGKTKPLLTNVPSPPPRYSDLGTMIDEYREREFREFATQSIEKDITSEISVPSGFGQVAGEYLEKLNRSYQDDWIDHDQLHELVKGFGKYLSWFPNKVPRKKIRKFCREAYSHILWKSFVDEEITRRQFVSLMGTRPKFFRKK